jgi:FkbM family methyltransferase
MTIHCPNVPGARVPVYEIFAEDCYHLPAFLGDLLDRPINVIDIGGHIGTFSCALAQLHPQATIDAFEPSPTTFSYLKRNIATNGYADRIFPHEAALAAEEGTAVLSDNAGGSGLNGLVTAGRSSGTDTTVRAVAFNDVIKNASGPVEVVKIDCEGGEYDLVFGSDPASWSSVKKVILEYHAVPGQTWDKLREWFVAAGYEVVDETVGAPGLGSAWLSRR